MAKRPPKTIRTLKDVTPHDRNANLGTQRGRDMLAHSLAEYGAGRSILVDHGGQVIAGNKTLEEAQRLNLPVTVVRTTGKELVVVQREDLYLSDPKAQALAVADNRISQVDLAWNRDALANLQAITDLTPFWTDDELAKLTRATVGDDTAAQLGALEYRLVIECRDEAHQKALLERLESEGLVVRALIS